MAAVGREVQSGLKCQRVNRSKLITYGLLVLLVALAALLGLGQKAGRILDLPAGTQQHSFE